MLPVERQNEIRTLIKTKKMLRINELSKQFNVSEMTIYRDIKPLIEDGSIIKTSGGISLADKRKNNTSPDHSTCIYCHKPNHSKTTYRLILQDNTIETACCAHCGLLRHRQLGDEVSHAICHDFFMNTTISASLTWYVMDTTLNMACCQPQVLTFENPDHAEKFIKGFDGKIFPFNEAMEMVTRKMHELEPLECCEEKVKDTYPL
ncbi:MAG TPA: DeoR family transcriptional regulator [Virgibacillus sp.]|nr:DeoR family transcriptional regulator [Virgibacillus sp.]